MERVTKPKVIAVTGTPGTGKTEVGKALARRLGARIVDLNRLIAEKRCYHLDRDGVKVAHLKSMQREFSKLIRAVKAPVVVEGLLSHLLDKKIIDRVIVLRTDPRVLKRRLLRRGYRNRKLQDNLESEALDIILCEAVDIHGVEKVIEVDTTGKRPPEVANMILTALEGKMDLRPGKISWLEKFYKF
jgi:adenylate kinase